MATYSLQKYDCSRCGFTYRKDTLKRQRGMLVCCDCYDDPSKIETPNPRWRSPRDNSTTTTAVNNPTVYSITAAGGISTLSQSQEARQNEVHEDYFMRVVGSGGAITITANPQIVTGTDGDRLTLRGTSDTSTITINNGNGVSLVESIAMVLKDGDAISFVYTSSDTTWREVSRYKGGI